MWLNPYIYDTTHSYVACFIHFWFASFIRDTTHSYVTCLIYAWRYSYICDMPHSYVTWPIRMWRDSFICDINHSYVTWLIHTWHNPFIQEMTHSYVTWIIYIWHVVFTYKMTRAYIYVPHSYIYDTPHTYILQEPLLQVTWHVWMSRVTRMNDSCHTYEWVMSRVWMSPITLTHGANWRLVHTRDMTRLYVRHDTFTHMAWLIDICDMTHSYIILIHLTVIVKVWTGGCVDVRSAIWRFSILSPRASSGAAITFSYSPVYMCVYICIYT